MKLHITVDGATYDVDVEVADDPAPLPLPFVADTAKMSVPVAMPPLPAVAPAIPHAGGEDKVCRSPVTGTVMRVVAQPGQQIQPGDLLLVLEAMKMETNIAAPIAGVVARVTVKAGDAVRGQQVLVEFA
jgi:methylmalonyl-CoA carboxyltransferase small subunit